MQKILDTTGRVTDQSKMRPTKGEIRVTPASAHATAWAKPNSSVRLQWMPCSSSSSLKVTAAALELQWNTIKLQHKNFFLKCVERMLVCLNTFKSSKYSKLSSIIKYIRLATYCYQTTNKSHLLINIIGSFTYFAAWIPSHVDANLMRMRSLS